MLLRSIITRSIAVTSLLAVSSLAQAGTPLPIAFVLVGPLAATASAPIPTLNEYLLIALGLLLAAIALKTLRNSRGAQKLFSIVVLGGGLAIGGMGVDRTLATPPGPIVETIEGSDCTGGDVRYGPDEGVTILKNDCSTSSQIKAFESEYCALDTENAECKVNDVLAAGDSCSLPLCALD